MLVVQYILTLLMLLIILLTLLSLLTVLSSLTLLIFIYQYCHNLLMLLTYSAIANASGTVPTHFTHVT